MNYEYVLYSLIIFFAFLKRSIVLDLVPPLSPVVRAPTTSFQEGAVPSI